MTLQYFQALRISAYRISERKKVTLMLASKEKMIIYIDIRYRWMLYLFLVLKSNSKKI